MMIPASKGLFSEADRKRAKSGTIRESYMVLMDRAMESVIDRSGHPLRTERLPGYTVGKATVNKRVWKEKNK